MSKIKEGRTLLIILKVPQVKAGAPTPVGKVRPMLTVVPERGGCPYREHRVGRVLVVD
jgi:hypothetical protein